MHQRVDHPLEFEEQGLPDTARQAARPRGQALARQRHWPGRLLRLILLLVLFRSALGATEGACRGVVFNTEVLMMQRRPAKIPSRLPPSSQQRRRPPALRPAQRVGCLLPPASPVRATNAHWRRANADHWRCS